MAAAVSKIMRLQDLIAVAAKCRVMTRFRNTIGLPGTALDPAPAEPSDRRSARHRRVDPRRADARLRRCRDRHQPRDRQPRQIYRADPLSRRIARASDICPASPACWPTSRPRWRRSSAARRSIWCSSRSPGPRRRTASFGVDLALLREAREAALSLGRGTVGDNVMYFETGQGSALSAEAHHGVDQQTLEARAYAVARAFDPLLVNTVVGFIGPEYLFDGKQITRAGLEDHFCGKLLGLPMGVDVCYTNHAEADQDDMDALLTLLGVAGVQLHHGRARRRRRDAQLPEHLVPRRALSAPRARQAAGAGIRGVAANGVGIPIATASRCGGAAVIAGAPRPGRVSPHRAGESVPGVPAARRPPRASGSAAPASGCRPRRISISSLPMRGRATRSTRRSIRRGSPPPCGGLETLLPALGWPPTARPICAAPISAAGSTPRRGRC